MPSKHDIGSLEDIKLLVNTFYEKAQKDLLLGPVFLARVKDWNKHLNIMYTFWETVLLDQYTYKGQPYPKHEELPIDDSHFNRWVELFSANIDELFEGPVAENAKQRAKQFGMVFWSKMKSQRGG